MSRVRGLAHWTPRAKTLPLLENVREVFAQYEAQLPLTLRQVFYRLVAAFEFEKTEQAYGRLGETLNRARRAGLIPFASIRDDGVTAVWPTRFASREEFWKLVEEEIEDSQLDRQQGQGRVLEVWVEAAGMVPLVASAVRKYGTPVFSSSGFDSLTAKYEAASRFLERDVPTVVLHIGDYDPSGVALFEAVREDVTAIYEDRAGTEPTEFVRVAVTPEQIARYELPTAPPKAKDKRSAFTDTVTVQAEALPPDLLQAEIVAAIEERIDLGVLNERLERERHEHDLLRADVKNKMAEEDGQQ